MSGSSTAAPARGRALRAAPGQPFALRRLSQRAQTRLALAVTGLCLLAFGVVWVLAAFVPATHMRDAILLYRFGELAHPAVETAANGLLDLLSPLAYTGWALLILAVAVLRRRPRTALVLTLVLPAAPLSTELLKPLLAHPHAIAGWHWIGPASFPSGHATAATTLVLCALMAAPRALRPTVAGLGALFVAAVSVSLLVLAWHMPSDVVGGYLWAGACCSLAAAVISANTPRPAHGMDDSAAGAGAVGAGVP
ncbi:MAG TPA: phosphatase PAP2 family protein [Solirubrobacteraceae bacterium]|nr:phosphatase PAP2 family protein [Solirubrobacteraceae bacterium]